MDTLPEQIIHEVLFWLTDSLLVLEASADDRRFPLNERPPLLFTPNSCKFNNYSSVLQLSTTCRRFRRLLAPALFSFLSLVRTSEIDSILKYATDKANSAKHSQSFGTQYAKIIESIQSFAKHSALKQTPDQKCWRMNNYVTHLEATQDVLTIGSPISISAFPVLRHLKILDKRPLSNALVLFGDTQLFSLAIHLACLCSCGALISGLRKLQRLDLVLDMSTMYPKRPENNLLDPLGLLDIGDKLSNSSLKQLNLFIMSPEVLLLNDFLEFLTHTVGGSAIESLTIRTFKSRETLGSQWGLIESPNGPRFLAILKCAKLLVNLTLDYAFMKYLKFPQNYPITNEHEKSIPVSLNIVDESFGLPTLLPIEREVVTYIIATIRSTHVGLIYGRVQEGSHLNALSFINNLLSHLGSFSSSNQILIVSLYEAWSYSDDGMMRDYYQKVINSIEAESKNSEARKFKMALLNASRISRFDFNSPRYQKQEFYSVRPQGGLLSMDTKPVYQSELPIDNFNSAEASLRDLEYYSCPSKELSAIWF